MRPRSVSENNRATPTANTHTHNTIKQVAAATEYRDRVVTQKAIVETPVVTREQVLVQRPRLVTRTEVVNRPRTTYQTTTVVDTRAITRPVVTTARELFCGGGGRGRTRLLFESKDS